MAIETALEVETHEGVGDAAFVAEWDALCATDPQATLFHRARWLARFDEVLGGQRHLRVRGFRADGRLVGVLAETRELNRLPSGPQEILRLAGGDEVTDYLGPVAAPEHRAAVVAAYLDRIGADRAFDELVLGGLAEDAGWHELFASAAGERGLVVTDADVDDVCPVVDLEGGYGGYLDRLPSRMRQEFDRKSRKLARDVAPHEIVTLTPSEVPAGIDQFLAMAQQHDDTKAGFFRRPEMQRWFHALAEEYAADGTLRVHRLDVGGLNAAMTVSLVDGVRWGLYNSTLDPTLTALAPGMVLVWGLVRMAADEGREVFDLLRGDEAYKYRFGAIDRPLRTLTLVRR
jgi:CelD/BcsL family acetyltransferase involved in cellulose biosynthesis